MMGVSSLAKRLQAIDQLLPLRWRLPLRYHTQRLLGALEPEVALLPELLARRPRGVALDVGANVGIYTYALALAGNTVHAFEPQLVCCDVISAWASASGYAAYVDVHHVGAGASHGELTLFVPIIDGRQVRTRASFLPSPGNQTEIRVQVAPIDALAPANVSFIKIDVEGHELAVLQGAMRTLSRDTPMLLVEIDRERHTRDSFAEIVDLLLPLGYRCHALHDGLLQDLGENPWGAPTEIYNFLFLIPADDEGRQ